MTVRTNSFILTNDFEHGKLGSSRDSSMKDLKVRNLVTQTICNVRNAERIDALENRTRRNLLVIRGLKSEPTTHAPTSIKEKANYIHALLSQEISKLGTINKQTPIIKSLFLIPNGGTANTFQDIRITCNSAEDSQEIKSRILQAKQLGQEKWSDVEVSNDPVIATRVRISLLQAISRQIIKDGNQEATVSKYLDSPTLPIRSGTRQIKNLSYVDAILQYGAKLSSEDIDKAMKIAGKSFIGTHGSQRTHLLCKHTYSRRHFHSTYQRNL